ncbi:PAS domain-containing protein [Halieaceae bacterium IMCC14734]|uniref:PAS domain-containing protein n=1 Tax=Candidatus Litorirhabdus singularis TaxID=2518993 RepID=A0ABT3TFF6_9GAMM|nr:sigma 54-interacting transcriptional regulator [Candidatus Litorirhabdus singularis]MCX2980749.1 PAS domain-containing protein [Candidatus Litorirhabdus singularis]
MDRFYNYSAVPQIVVDPILDVIIEVNQEACRLLQRDRDSLKQQRVTSLFRTDLPRLHAFTQEVLENTRGFCDELQIEIGGQASGVEVIGRSSQAGEESFLHLGLQLLSELTVRRSRADALDIYHSGLGHWNRVASVFREFEHENRLLLDAAGEGIYGVDKAGNTTFVNPAARRILGYTLEELIGRNMHSTVHYSHGDGSHFEVDECPIFESLRDGKVHTVDDDTFWSRAGKPIDVEYTSTPILEGDEIVGVVVIFRDISEKKADRKRLMEVLEEVETLKNRLEQENAYLQEEISIEYNNHRIIGRSAGVQNTIRQINLVAPTGATTLIVGESGTGKELIARSIHEQSERSERPLIRVNCAAVPEDLFESEFFGHVKGAFTGATGDRPGRFELADGGTLFLDEVAEIPLHLQGKLLRVLQEQQFERVGESATRHVDVRIVAATNKDLRQLVDAGKFREDLYFRLNVFPITSVPLRERREDIPLLAQLFLQKAATRAHKPDLKISLSEIEKLGSYHWPGNIRELENVIERQVILAQGDAIRMDDSLISSDQIGARTSLQPLGELESEPQNKQRQRRNILMALEKSQGKVFGKEGAAELLGIKPTTLASRIKKLHIDPRSFKNA